MTGRGAPLERKKKEAIFALLTYCTTEEDARAVKVFEARRPLPAAHLETHERRF
jgi:hypothetical protein